MSNVATHTGTCECCGREGAALRLSRHEDRKLRRHTYVCVDDRACFSAWQRLPTNTRHAQAARAALRGTTEGDVDE